MYIIILETVFGLILIVPMQLLKVIKLNIIRTQVFIMRLVLMPSFDAMSLNTMDTVGMEMVAIGVGVPRFLFIIRRMF